MKSKFSTREGGCGKNGKDGSRGPEEREGRRKRTNGGEEGDEGQRADEETTENHLHVLRGAGLNLSGRVDTGLWESRASEREKVNVGMEEGRETRK
jgi:hypothetical protein